MPNLEVKYHPGPGEALYFQMLYRTADTTILKEEEFAEGDDDEVKESKKAIQIAKKSLQLSRMIELNKIVNTPAFNFLEEVLYSRVR